MEKTPIQPQQVLVIMPAFNEARIIGSVIKELKKVGWRKILVIDDGSTDLTTRKALKAGAKVLAHRKNRGKGAALKTGFAAARKLAFPVVVTMDGDGQHFPQDIAKLVKKIEVGNEVVLGFRKYKRATMPGMKILANHLGNFITWLAYGLWVKDSQSGLRAYSLSALEKIKLKHNHYEVDSEIIGQIKKNQLIWTEVPIKVSYGFHDQSKTDRQKSWSSIKTMWRVLFN